MDQKRGREKAAGLHAAVDFSVQRVCSAKTFPGLLR
jgi:hypothetical protein